MLDQHFGLISQSFKLLNIKKVAQKLKQKKEIIHGRQTISKKTYYSNKNIDALKLIANARKTRVEDSIKIQAQKLINLAAKSNQKHNKTSSKINTLGKK